MANTGENPELGKNGFRAITYASITERRPVREKGLLARTDVRAPLDSVGGARGWTLCHAHWLGERQSPIFMRIKGQKTMFGTLEDQ